MPKKCLINIASSVPSVRFTIMSGDFFGMVTEVDRPKIILISQWPKIKNAEYQLIENIKRSDVDIRVVDYLGFDVETGENINDPNLSENYDFALALHFDTPNVLNICCYLWVSNPLEYLFLKHDYFSLTLHNYRSFEGYFFNEAWPLKRHVKNLLDMFLMMMLLQVLFLVLTGKKNFLLY